jgi:glycosyltransferase involved in cell wall biosynthesis
MKLLIVTRKIDRNDERAGFFFDWVLEFAKNLDKLIIICQELGDASGLPSNVEIHSLGKERGKGRFSQLITYYLLLITLLPRVDGVFSHMMPVYAMMAGPWCKIYRKKLIQWYTHKKVNLMLRLANFWVDEFVTASAESFQLKTKKKVNIFGHGINFNKFKTQNSNVKTINQNSKFTILSVGRISPVKNIDLMVKAAEHIKLGEPELREKILFQIIGGLGLPEQASYMKDLEKEVQEKSLDGLVDFLGPLPPKKLISYYQNCDLFLNFSDTGSLDKAVLEAMAAGDLILTSNEAFKNMMPAELFLQEKTAVTAAEKIKEIFLTPTEHKEEWRRVLQKEVSENHNLENLIPKIIRLYE